MGEGMRPPHIGGFTAADGTYMPLPVSATTYTNHGCRCEGCLAAKREAHRQYRNNASKDAKARMNKRKTDRLKRQADEGKVIASNIGKPWTDSDIAIACDRSLTVRQAATLLGRTYFSVKQMRSQSG